MARQALSLGAVEYQGVEQIGILADGLAKSELWYFWWN